MEVGCEARVRLFGLNCDGGVGACHKNGQAQALMFHRQLQHQNDVRFFGE